MSWVLAKSLEDLRDEVNARWPNRDKRSDGTIGDAAHASRASDHNPWLNNTVRAMDIDVDGIDAAWYAEHLRKLGRAGDRRLRDGGYVIFNRRITKSDFSGWSYYGGANPHTSHVHLSVGRTGYNLRGSWGVAGDDENGEDDDMKLSDQVKVKGEKAGKILGADKISVDGALGYGAASLIVAEKVLAAVEKLAADQLKLAQDVKWLKTEVNKAKGAQS